MSETTKLYTDADLRYAATARCPCGAGLAYPLDTGMHGAWDCSDILTGRAIPSGQPGAVEHTDRLPFAFYEIKSDDQPSAEGRTTRPRPLTDEEQLQRAAEAAGRAFDAIDIQGASEDSARSAQNILGPALTAYDRAARAHPEDATNAK